MNFGIVFVTVNDPIEEICDLNSLLGYACLCYLNYSRNNLGCSDELSPLLGIMYNFNLEPVEIHCLETGLFSLII